MNFSVVDVKSSYKGINYGDGQDKLEFTFDRDITETEFVEFLKRNGHEIIPKTSWYEDYTVISGNGNKWVYTVILVYTD